MGVGVGFASRDTASAIIDVPGGPGGFDGKGDGALADDDDDEDDDSG